ncbi:hypothetical protein H2198_001016 [Neophaeococcomyces mojaviensis]|uniref:Uncharacterized protein n=1 Tax=Neophaeococcomyces mojaviensis TaxID=3383035 RepID=A0ACC3AIQ5_9EURO|nr:hypothetical protein H2198_001016 [Knufia sp. JES_112]
MADLQFQLASLPPTSLGGNLDIDRMPLHPTQQLLEGLVEFSFIAIFPFYNHVDDILKCIRRMKRLKKLFMKLGPEPSSTILEDEIKAANYHIDLNDPWTELSTSYQLAAHTVRSMGAEAQLRTFVVDDFKMTGVWDSVEDTISDILATSWIYNGTGIWSKQAIPVSIEPPAESS